MALRGRLQIISTFVVIALLGTCRALVAATSCGANYAGRPSPECVSIDAPFCVLSSNNPTTYQCSECLSDCDCPIGKFCSNNSYGGKAGSCVKFEAEERDCVSMVSADLLDASIPDTFKCGDVVRSDNRIVMVSRPSGSACVEGICRACNPYSSTHICADGRVSARGCAIPGVVTNLNGLRWASGEYYQDPAIVWQAIFFPLLIIIVVTQCLMLWKERLNRLQIPFGRFRSGSSGGYESFNPQRT